MMMIDNLLLILLLLERMQRLGEHAKKPPASETKSNATSNIVIPHTVQ